MTDKPSNPPAFPDEEILPDNYPVHGGYLYVADGKVIQSDLFNSNVRRLKQLLKAVEIRRCNIIARRDAMLAERENDRG